MNKFRTIIFLLITVSSNNILADNTTGYTKIKDLKAFSTYLSIYLNDSQTHNCDNTPSLIFRSDISNTHYTSFLLTAFTAGKGVNLKYTCIDNQAYIDGIRLNINS